MAHPKIEELSAFRDNPGLVPPALLDDIVALINPLYDVIGLSDICGEACIVKVKTDRGELLCLKIAMPNITNTYENVSIWDTITFKKEKRNTFAERFLAGARIQKNLFKTMAFEEKSHFHIPAVYAISETPFLYYEMEWIESVKILNWLQTKKSLRYAMHVYVKLLEAVSYCHEKGIVHRDLKPNNLMAWKNNSVCILDWTTSKKAGEERDLTKVGVEIGTFPYASSKQLLLGLARDATYVDDVNSLGYILWAFYNMQEPQDPPPGAQNDLKKMQEYRKKLLNGIQTPFREVFAKATDITEANRYQIVHELKIDMEEAIRRANFKDDGSLQELTEFDKEKEEIDKINAYLDNECKNCHGNWCHGNGLCRTIVWEAFRMIKEIKGDK